MLILSGSRGRQPSPSAGLPATDNCASCIRITPLFAGNGEPLQVSRKARDATRAGARGRAAETWRSTVERARWTDERHDDRMTVIDTTFDRVFEELRAERARLADADD